MTVIPSPSEMPGQVGVLPPLGDLVRLLGGTAAELDVHPAAREQHRDGGAPAAGADHGRLAHRRQPAQPLPLELDVGPDPGRDRRGQRRRGVVLLGERERLAHPQADLPRLDLPAVADVLGPEDRDREDRRPGLEREPADAAVRGRERPAADPRALGEDADRAAALEDAAGRSRRCRGRPRRGEPGRRRGGSGSIPASAARRARPWPRSAGVAAMAATRRGRRGRGSCGGSRRRSGRDRCPCCARGRAARAAGRSGTRAGG